MLKSVNVLESLVAGKYPGSDSEDMAADLGAFIKTTPQTNLVVAIAIRRSSSNTRSGADKQLMINPTTPGWYPNPENSDQECLWNGRIWTSNIRTAKHAIDVVTFEAPTEDIWGGELPEMSAIQDASEVELPEGFVNVTYRTAEGEEFVIAENLEANPTPWITGELENAVEDTGIEMGFGEVVVITTINIESFNANERKTGRFRR